MSAPPHSWQQRSRQQRGSSPSGISRRTFLTGAAATVGGLALAGCGSPVSAGITAGGLDKNTVSYWNLFGGGDGVRMQEMQDGFRKDNPDLDLSAVTLAWGAPYYTKLSLATLGDKPPDVAVSHLTRMTNFVQAGLLEELTPERLSQYGLSAAQFNATAWEAGLVEDKAYAIPLDTHPLVLFYNTDLCAAAGLLDEDGVLPPFEDGAAFEDALAKVKEAGAAEGLVVSVVADPSTNWRQFNSLYSQLGGEVLADDGARIVLDDAKATEAMEYLRGLAEKGLMSPSLDYGAAIATFASGGAGFYAQGEWEITTFQTAEMPFSMTLYPNVFGGNDYKVHADSHVLVLPKQPDGGGEARWDRSMRFVQSMLDQSLTWAQGGHVPTYLPIAESSEYADLTPQSSYAAAADAAAYDPPAWYGGSGSDFETLIGSSIAAAIQGQSSTQQAIDQIQSKLSTLADTTSPL